MVARVDERIWPVVGSERFIHCDTLLLSVGLIPENELSKGAGVKLDMGTRGPITTETMETSVPGIFSCGNVATVFDLVDYVAETGASAGRNAAMVAAGTRGAVRNSVGIRAGENVRIMFPQAYSFEDDLVLFLRSAESIERPVRVSISPPELRLKRPYARPNEMIRVKVPKGKLVGATGPIEVRITEA